MKSHLLAFAALAAMSDISREPSNNNESVLERRERLKAQKERAQIRNNKRKGLTEFHYGCNSLWALNKKSADKKATKKGWL